MHGSMSDIFCIKDNKSKPTADGLIFLLVYNIGLGNLCLTQVFNIYIVL